MRFLTVFGAVLMYTVTVSFSQWEADMLLSDTTAVSTFGNTSQVCTSIDDYVHVVWSDFRVDNSSQVFYTRSTDAGNTWESDYGMSRGTSSGSASITASGNAVHVMWYTAVADTEKLFYMRSTNNGQFWDEEKVLVSSVNTVRLPAITASGQNICMNWRNDEGGNSDIYSMYSSDNGTTWSTPIPLTTDPGYAKGSSISSIGASVYSSWRDVRNGVPGIFVRRSTDYGITWEEEVMATSVTDSSLIYTSISATNSGVHLTWYDKRDGNTEIYYKRSVDGGKTWEPEIQLSNDPAYSSNPHVVANGSLVHVLWIDRQNGPRQVFYRKSSTSGATWDDAIPVSGIDAIPEKVYAAISAQKLHVFFHDIRFGHQEIYYQRNATGNTATDVEEPPQTSIILLPCPVTDVMSIRSTDLAIENVNILNITGEVVASYTPNNTSNFSINISALPIGTYFAQLHGKGLSATRIFVKD